MKQRLKLQKIVQIYDFVCLYFYLIFYDIWIDGLTKTQESAFQGQIRQL